MEKTVKLYDQDSHMYEFSARYTMQLENSRLLLIDASYKANLEALTTWKSEYYYAYETLDFFMQNGYSKEVACGIIGNMMVETSGTSLKLNPTIHSPGDEVGSTDIFCRETPNPDKAVTILLI